MCFVMGYPDKLFLCALDSRCKGTLWYRTHLFDLVCYIICIFDNDFPCLVLAEILKLRHHFLCSPQIEGSLLLSIIEAHARKDYLAVYRVLLVYKMYVTGSAGGYAEPVAQSDHLTVEVAKLIVVTGNALSHHEPVVAYGLYLKVIVEPRKIVDIVLIAHIQYRLEQFS